MFAEGRELLWWYSEEIRGLFPDDALDPYAPLFPSERLPSALGADVGIAPPMHADTFRRALRRASLAHLKGTVTVLFPHLLRHACATHNYESGCRFGMFRCYWGTSGRPQRWVTWLPRRGIRSGPAWSRPGVLYVG
ncbi:integrase [Streptomyces griseochromogenes]|uniref:Integrase n=1 Tax=Streptomyces griseochromogenes TaxID=68214 RepID=A0A1B1AU22_9ACTN|nr:hypothetical protein [Streptomyces griseochromogenes]ANP50020.1 hypothetical protein AVL59_10715 [Streptomyces griseochromogenes]MBP2048375.1 integrase [Streptomyces griseochromogenes]